MSALIGQLSNRQFGIKADQLLAALDSNAPVGVDMPLCRCGCGSEVASGRKFVSQSHYDRWRSLLNLFTLSRSSLAAARGYPGVSWRRSTASP
jgi:hypothetical protein